MPSRIIRNEDDLRDFTRFLGAFGLPFTVTITKGVRRSNPQNATFHLWLGQIAAEFGMSQGEAKAECKLRFGLPIMERDNPDWVAKWQPLYGPLSYAQRLLLFEAIPLTRLLRVPQMSEFMNAMQREYRGMGVHLVDPDALKYEAEFGPTT